MRDKHRDESYFRNTMEYNRNKIKLTIKNAELVGDTIRNNEINSRVSLVLNRYYFDLIKSMYSVGESYQEIAKVVNNYIETTCGYWTKDCGYESLLNSVSIAVLFDITGDTLNNLDKLLKREKIKHPIVKALVSFFGILLEDSDKDIFPTLFKEEFSKIISANKLDQSEELERYMSQWYAIHNGNSWYRSHEGNNENYTGYWSFEAAAIAIVLGIDDSGLKDTNYYPYDLVKGQREAKLKGLL